MNVRFNCAGMPRMRLPPRQTITLLVALMASRESVNAAEAKTFRSPVTMQILDQRRQYQEGKAKEHHAFSGFQFTNRIEQSQITFENHVVDDASKNYKAAHYDHGNG